ncbi:MAG TPA: histidine phosphatase family protein [Bacteroidales bacterium]|nr:histidine phosphatase family protein [Bacteroidales bacterium]
MKKLIFVRHGKAEEVVNGMSDFERSLTAAGKKISRQMAKTFLKKEGSPGLIISSPAFRAFETACIFAGQQDERSYDKIMLKSDLYFGTNLQKLNKILGEIDNSVEKITLFGHNPSFTDMPDTLSKTGCGPVPKSGVVCISFDVDKWEDINRGEGKLEYFLKPDK